jgi:AcrR family transcriptional regulator
VSSPSREAILCAAGRLFGERGYRAVTVREIAANAGVSASLVMKLFLSKDKLYAAARAVKPLLDEPDVPTAELGRAFVFRVLMRREGGIPEPWATIPLAVLDSPNPEAARAEIRERYLGAIAQLIGDATPDRRFASTVTALMTGFGESIRTLGIFDGWDIGELVEHYGAIIQAQIDAATAAT